MSRLFGPGRYTPWERVLYAPVYVLARVLWRVEIEWRDGLARGPSDLLAERLPDGALLVANHSCSLDPFFVQLVSGRRVHWMVAGEYFHHFLFGPVLRSYQAIPTNRAGVDTASTKRAIALAKSGRFVGMFPEGRINRTDKPLLSIRPGAAIVAQRASVPLVPIWIDGAPRGYEVYSALFMPARVRIIVGPAQFCPDSSQEGVSDANESLDGAGAFSQPGRLAKTERVQARDDAVAWIADVMQQSMRLGGNTTERVQLAGRKWLDN